MATRQRPGKALVVRGGWEGHSPVEISDRFARFLRDREWDVRLSDSLDVFLDSAALAATDLVVQCWTMGTISKEQSAGLSSAVRAGTGLAGWHGGVCDSFRSDTGYHWMLGGQFVMHPPGFLDHDIDLVQDRAGHPVISGLPTTIPVRTEQYYVHYDPSAIDVLATTTFATGDAVPEAARGVTCPAVWTRQWGHGRVFVSTVGHKPDDFDVRAIRELTERGLLWAAR